VLLERDGRSIRLIVDVPVGCEDAPAVVFLPGFKIDAGRYAETGRYLASHGFVVARAGLEGTIFSADHGEMARDASRILDWLGSEESVGQIPGRVDPSAMGIAGHSLGGKLATMAAIADPRIKGVFAIDPVNQRPPDLLGPGGPIEQLTVPLGLIGQTRDTRRGAAPKVVTPEGANYTAFLDRAVNAKSAFAVTIRGADHFGFLDQWAPIELATPGRFTQNRPQVLQETRTLMTSFFRLHLKGEALDPRAYADPQRLIQR
jgi:pimeloyl-ACP methyl ester carboxylesterase